MNGFHMVREHTMYYFSFLRFVFYSSISRYASPPPLVTPPGMFGEKILKMDILLLGGVFSICSVGWFFAQNCIHADFLSSSPIICTECGPEVLNYNRRLVCFSV